MTRSAALAAAAAAIGLFLAAPAGADHHEGQAGDASASAHAVLRDTDGKEVGRAALHETPHGVLVHLRLDGVAPGAHAFHVHETGRCEPPFTSAGGHFNPAGRDHGLEAPGGYHAGDLPNLYVPESGALQVQVLARAVTLGTNETSLLDADGSALVVHAGPDDYETDPAGAAGDRIACGVVERGAAAD